MVAVSNELRSRGYESVLPADAELFAAGDLSEQNIVESTDRKRHGDLIRDYFEKIKTADAVLIANVPKHGREGYIGGNAFLEFAFGHVLGKRVFLLYDFDPESPYAAELAAMDATVIDGDVSCISV